MPSSNVKSLIGKLNDTCRKALESAAGLCLSQTHYEVDLEHFLIKLLEMPQTDILQILRHFEINQDRLTADLTRAMEGFKTGNARTPALSPRIPRMVQEAWVLASIDYQAPSVRSGHILLALMSTTAYADGDGDSRHLVKLPKMMQEHMLSNMRDQDRKSVV